MHSTSKWLAFLAAIQLGIALKYGFVVHEYTLPHPLEIYRKTPKYRHFYILDIHIRGPYGVQIRGVPLYLKEYPALF